MPDSIPQQPGGRILAEQRGPIGWLTIDHVARHNALTPEMWVALGDALTTFAADEAIRCVVLTGAGSKAFAAGSDISRFEAERRTPEQVAEYKARTQRAHELLRQLDTPTIAMIRGHCIGGGLALALSCDLRISSNEADFAIPAARLGLGYELHSIRRLTQIVGPANAKDILFGAQRLNAAQALAMGLLNRAVPGDQLEAFVLDYASIIAGNAPLTLRAVKHAIAESLSSNPDEALCARLYQACFDSADYQEGRRAFLEKRRPEFLGR